MTCLGLYVQVPFCQTRCTYCNFHTGVVSSSRFAPYVAAVCREIETHRQLYAGCGIKLPQATGADLLVDTVYIGGGTPSLLDPVHLQTILDTIRATFAGDFQEVTLEADPETVDAVKAAAWAAAGINRVSLGVQSFSDRELAAAGRMHRQEDVYRANSTLRAAGISNISCDLIAGLALQTGESWRESLQRLIDLAPEHVSVYLLEVDEKSRLGNELLNGGTRYGAKSVPSEDQMAEFYHAAQSTLHRAGHHHYEISNWARPGFESRHNLKYWRRQPYLGFGAGAHSFAGTQRWSNTHDPANYVKAIQHGALPLEEVDVLTSAAALEEELFLGLRQLDGIDVSRIEKEYGAAVVPRFAPLASSGLVEWHGPVVKLAPSRLSVSNEVFVELLR